MDRLHIFVFFVLGVVLGSSDLISGSAVMTATPGDNVTLYCDCKMSSGVYIIWYRNCSHENQPSLVLRTSMLNALPQKNQNNTYAFRQIPKFEFVRNFSSNTHDLRISNVSVSEEGLYYCGTEQQKLEDNGQIIPIYLYSYGNVTRVIVGSRNIDPHAAPHNYSTCWMLLFSLCPAFVLLSSLCFSLLVFHLCRKTESQGDGQRSDTGGRTRLEKDEDLRYAALEVLQLSQRPKQKLRSFDCSIYSLVHYMPLQDEKTLKE